MDDDRVIWRSELRELTNKVNFVLRAGGDRETKVAAMDAVLADA